jgi:hypothetical protein
MGRAGDPVEPRATTGIAIVVDGVAVPGLAGQTIAGMLLGVGRIGWRTTTRHGRPRGVFCGIGVCFDCLVTVNGLRDVRACQRRAADGDVITTTDDLGPPSDRPDAAADRSGAAAYRLHGAAVRPGAATEDPR